MNVEELLGYNPPINEATNALKRPISEPSDEIPHKKQSRFGPPLPSQPASSETIGKPSPDPRDIAELLESNDVTDDIPIDDNAIRKLILNFEKRVYRNQEMRIKFPDHPRKFMDSELELHFAIEELHILATVPEHYYLLVNLNSVKSLLSTLNHENVDICVAVIDLIKELSDGDSEDDADAASVSLLVDALIDNQIISLIVQIIDRLDDTVKEESDAIHSSLGIIENILEVKPRCHFDVANQGLLAFLLRRLRAKIPFDQNKLYTSELLSVLLQDNDEVRKLLGEQDGIDILLQQLAVYKRTDPSTPEEIELMENLFNCLCSCLMLTGIRDKFLHGEGLQLMNLMLREKKLSRFSALKVLDFAMCADDGIENCQKFVDILGLRTIFPLFMKPPKCSKAIGMSDGAVVSNVASIVSSLVRNCEGQQRQRLLSKFIETNMAKVDRLIELHFRYLEKVQAIDHVIDRLRDDLEEEPTAEQDEDFYLRRLEAGLFTLHHIDSIILELSAAQATIKERILQGLNLHRGSIKVIRNLMREYAGHIGTTQDRSREQQRILNLVDKF